MSYTIQTLVKISYVVPMCNPSDFELTNGTKEDTVLGLLIKAETEYYLVATK